jgi:RHS repeat-associated protein
MLTADKEETLSAPMVWTDECVLPLAASGVYSKTRVRGSNPENMHYSRATAPLKIELRWGCENSSEKTAVGSGVTFKYDPLGRRIYKSSSSSTSVFAYDGDNLIEETNSSGTVVARYEQTQNIDEPLAMLRSSTASYYNADGLGSVTSLTNSSGAAVQTYTFDSFGNVTASSGSLVNPFQYTGREMDAETGLYYYRARYYDPGTGRFLTEDPLGWAVGNATFYPYARNNPANFNDPFGLYPNLTPEPRGGPPMPVPGAPHLPWRWDPNPGNDRLGTYRPEGWNAPDKPEVNWDPLDGGHWDLKPGDGSPTKRYDRWGNPIGTPEDPHRGPSCPVPTKKIPAPNLSPATTSTIVIIILIITSPIWAF